MPYQTTIEEEFFFHTAIGTTTTDYTIPTDATKLDYKYQAGAGSLTTSSEHHTISFRTASVELEVLMQVSSRGKYTGFRDIPSTATIIRVISASRLSTTIENKILLTYLIPI